MPRRSVLALLIAAIVSTAHAAPSYRVVDLGSLSGSSYAIPSGFGAGRTVLGGSYTVGGTQMRAVRWNLAADASAVSIDDFGGLDGYNSSMAYGMNAAGWVVGYSNTADPQPRGVLWRNGEKIDIERGADGSANIYAFDVNDAGVITGMITKSGGGGGWDGAVWVERANQPGRFDRTFLPLHPLGGLNGWTEGHQVLNDGRVFGRSNLYFNGDRATLWSNDAAHTPVLLEPLPNSIQSMPGDINELGDAVGYTMYVYGMNRPTRWSRDAAHTPSMLPILPTDNGGEATVVSPDGAIVLGHSFTVDYVPFPWEIMSDRMVLWVEDQVFALDDLLVGAPQGCTMLSLADMNSDGWITGLAKWGNASHVVVLVPETNALAVGDAPASRVALASPWPNPARGDVRLSFTLANPGAARLSVHDAQGRLVARLADGAFAPGRHEYMWDGRDAGGAPTQPGLYFATLEANGVRESVRIVRMR